MIRTRRLIAFFCILAIVFAALAPSQGHVSPAVLTLLRFLAPAVLVVLIRPGADGRGEQQISLLALDASRAPPAVLATVCGS